MRLLRLFALSLLLLVFPACGGGDEEGATPEGGSADGATGGPDGTSSGGSVSDGGRVELLPGVVWERVDVPASDGPSAAYGAFAVDNGFVAYGQSAPDGINTTFAAWRGDASGTEWAVAAVDPTLSAFTLTDLATGSGLLVAVGADGERCVSDPDRPLVRRCSTSFARAIWSDDDGATWQPAETSLGAAGTYVTAVAATGDGFVAAGRDEVDGERWQIVVWASDDGRSWREVRRFSDDRWPAYNPDLMVVGASVLLLGQTAVCSEPFLNGDDWVLGSPFFRQTRLWSAADPEGTWDEVDLVAAGMTDAIPATLDCDNQSETRGDATTEGWFLPPALDADGAPDPAAGVTLAAATGLWQSSDGLSWERAGELEQAASQPWALTAVAGGWVNAQFLSQQTAVVPTVRTSSDLITWVDRSDFSPGLPPVSRPISWDNLGTGSQVGGAAGGGAVVVAVGADQSSGSSVAAFYRSEAATVTIPSAEQCEPVPGLVCPRGDFSFAELAGVDLSGADLAFADLGNADLTGANLSGADLEGADLGSADLTGANLSGARLVRASLSRATLDGTNFAEADLSDATGVEPVATANWTDAKLRGLNLLSIGEHAPWSVEGADLTGTSLSVDQVGMSFAGTTLIAASLRGDLADADFRGVDLSGAAISASLEGALFEGASWNEDTLWAAEVCPDGFEPPQTFPPTDCTDHFFDR